MTTIHPPRYTARMLPAEQRVQQFIWGLFDTFTHSFVVGTNGYEAKFSTEHAAQRNADQMNRAYERATAP